MVIVYPQKRSGSIFRGEYLLCSGSNDLADVGWYRENSGDETHPVGQKKRSGFGLYDMSVNILEWCSDSLDRNL